MFLAFFSSATQLISQSMSVTVDDLTNMLPDMNLLIDYHPYPNQSSFLLGEWYWNDGAKKSQSSFRNLLHIVGHPEFRPEAVVGTNWQRINAQLDGNPLGRRFNGGDEELDGWKVDEVVNRDWTDTPI